MSSNYGWKPVNLESPKKLFVNERRAHISCCSFVGLGYNETIASIVFAKQIRTNVPNRHGVELNSNNFW